MIVVYTCPECGHDLRETTIATYPPIYRKECPNCHWYWESTPEPIKRIPFNPDPIDTVDTVVPMVNDFSPFASPACQSCASNPANGGDGICHCTLGQNIIY